MGSGVRHREQEFRREDFARSSSLCRLQNKLFSPVLEGFMHGEAY